MPDPVTLTTQTLNQTVLTRQLRARLGGTQEVLKAAREKQQDSLHARVELHGGAVDLIEPAELSVGAGTVEAIKQEVRGDPVQSLQAATKFMSRDSADVLLDGGPLPIRVGSLD